MLFESTSRLIISAIGVLPNVAKLSNSVYPFLLCSRPFRIATKVSINFTLRFVPFIELYLFGFNVTCNRQVCAWWIEYTYFCFVRLVYLWYVKKNSSIIVRQCFKMCVVFVSFLVKSILLINIHWLLFTILENKIERNYY